ncbi:MAG: hypothetical protein K2Z80_32640 [Xanthobacteraceae bacterium]|nr:hypothetical protein [Xanthobacteraceae bacterium]
MPTEAWKPIVNAPFDCDLQLAVLEGEDVHVLVACCRRARQGWINAATGKPIDVHPTHWREWTNNQ